VSYNGVGGALAGNGMLITVDGVAVAQVATNDANYVAMEALAAKIGIGGTPAGSNLNLCDVGVILIDASAWPAAKALIAYTATRTWMGI